MALEDRTLTCVGCEAEFVFTIAEQTFFAEKGFESDPKRCKKCRGERRKRRNNKRRGNGIYRSPAFEGSAPRHQKIRGRHDHGRGEYRAPASSAQPKQERDEYRSPAFPEQNQIKPEDEYRAPGFREAAEINVTEEYRAPGFKDQEDVDPREEYRSPAYQDLREKYTDEKPMFAIVCAGCGQDAMVPFLPDEKEIAFCQECYRAEKAASERAENESPKDETDAEVVEAAGTPDKEAAKSSSEHGPGNSDDPQQ